MGETGKRLSEEAMLREWEEIQAAQRDMENFAVLYDRYYAPIFRFIFKRTADESLSADLSSQVFFKAMQKLSTYSYQGVPFSAWLFRIAANEVRLYYRKSQKKRVVMLEDQHCQALLEEDNYVNLQALQEQMIAALDSLKPDDLEIIELRIFEAYSYKEIAEILDISLSNAKVKVHRIIARLKKQLNG
ncbi:MAG TPA: sigma-70 family RNA polymerase sigma factor [Saprospiraceae bacterium]|nr:sigma-70 family RNA polymerase sigma factor [Saprospiraceae bacterium]